MRSFQSQCSSSIILRLSSFATAWSAGIDYCCAMKISEIQANQGNISVEAEIVAKEEPRTFTKFGKSGQVCSATLRDSSGEIRLTLWNDDIEKVEIGSRIKLENGWCSEFREQKQLSAGKYGKLEIIMQNK